MEKIHKPHLLVGGKLGNRLGVDLKILVVGLAVGKIGVFEVLVGNGREQDKARLALSVKLEAAILVDHARHVLLELADTVRPRKRLVVTKHHEDHIRLDVGKVLIVGGKALVTRPLIDRVAGEGHVAETQIVSGVCLLNGALHPAVVLHAVGETIADDGNDIVILEFELGLGHTAEGDGKQQGAGDELQTWAFHGQKWGRLKQ